MSYSTLEIIKSQNNFCDINKDFNKDIFCDIISVFLLKKIL